MCCWHDDSSSLWWKFRPNFTQMWMQMYTSWEKSSSDGRVNIQFLKIKTILIFTVTLYKVQQTEAASWARAREVNTQILLHIYPEWPSQYRNDPSGYKVQYFPLFASHFYSARCQVWPHTFAIFQLFAGPVRPPNNVTSVCDGGIIIITTKKDMSCITHVALNAPSAWDSTNVTQVLLHRTVEFPRKTLVCTGWWMLFYLSVVLSL